MTHILSDPTQAFYSSDSSQVPRLCCSAIGFAYVTFCLSIQKQPSILRIPALFLDSVVQWVLHKSRSVWVLNIAYITSCPRLFLDLVVQRLLHKSRSVWHSVYIPKDVFLMSEPEAGHGRKLGMFVWRKGELTQSTMADGSGNGSTRHISMPSSLLTTCMPWHVGSIFTYSFQKNTYQSLQNVLNVGIFDLSL